MMASHSPLLITLITFHFLLYLTNLLFSLMSLMQTEQFIGFDLFPNRFPDNEGENGISPLSGIFSIWGPIYIWHLVWMFYGFSCICRRAPDGPVYTNPALLTPAFYTVSICNWGFSCSWFYVSTYTYRWWAFGILVGMVGTTYICIGLTHKAVAEHYDTLVKQGRMKEVWLMRGIVQNGYALYGGWCTVATQLQLASALAFEPYPQLEVGLASSIALGILCAELVLYVILDWFVIEKHSRYTVTPYLVVIVALSGSMAKNWNPLLRNSIITAVLMAFVCMATVVKFVLLFVRHSRDAKKVSEILPTTETKPDIRL